MNTEIILQDLNFDFSYRIVQGLECRIYCKMGLVIKQDFISYFSGYIEPPNAIWLFADRLVSSIGISNG